MAETKRVHQSVYARVRTYSLKAFLLLLCSSYHPLSANAVQKQSPRNRPRPKVAVVDYSKFSHNTKKHQAACDTCHKVPTTGWQQSSTYPDITDYPGHEACVGCHRPQFFRGLRPTICSVCHTKTSPRDEARLAFRNPTRQLQFTIEFPHDRHQDVIALLKGQAASQQFQAFAHVTRSLTDEKAQTYNNCTICHGVSSVLSAPPAGWPDGFQPKPETFKSAPSGHDACFNCHWKSQEPVARNCAGCHKLASIPFSSSVVPARVSLKFMHDGGGEKKNHVLECASCHINITKSASVRGLKPDVPITSCTECHNKVGTREDLNKELGAIDKNRAFVCSYCHTSNVGSLDPPASHYLIAERPPIKRKEIR